MSSIAEYAFWNRCASDFRFFAQHLLKIRLTNDSGFSRGKPIVPFWPLSPEQEAIVSWVEECIARGIPVRIIVDKCRKLGMSTLIEALLYWLCCFRQEFQAVVIAQATTPAKKILEIAQRFDRKLPPDVHEQIGAKHPLPANGLSWKEDWGSNFTVMTQRSEETARGGDPNALHISELGLWHKRRATISDEDAMTSLLDSLGDSSGTFGFIESTACGQVGTFYDRYVRAQAKWNDERVPFEDKGWRPYFFTFQGVPKYSKDAGPEWEEKHAAALALHIAGDEAGAQRIATELRYCDDDNGSLWWERVLEYGLTASQMRWVLAKVEDHRGDVAVFDQEFPLTWQLSFVGSGRPVFPAGVIEQWTREASTVSYEAGTTLVDLGVATDLQGVGDAWRIWKRPEPGHEYTVGTDTATGDPEGDYCVIQVFDRHTREFVAEHYGRVPPDVLGQQAVVAASWYNRAVINPEENNDGGTTIRKILDLGYPHLQLRRPGLPMPADVQTNWRNLYGTQVTGANRNDLVNLLRENVRQKKVTFRSKRTLSEMTTFVYDRRSKPDHMLRTHSDGIFGAIHALYADYVLTSVEPLRPVEAPKTDEHWSIKARQERRAETIGRAEAEREGRRWKKKRSAR